MRYSRFASLSSVATALASFCAAILLLDSAGIHTWADRLPLGPERKIALPLVTTLDRALRPLRLGQMRHAELVQLARSGWGDDPALVASPEFAAEGSGEGFTTPGAASASAGAGDGAKGPASDGAGGAPTPPHKPVFATGNLIAPPLRTTIPDLHLRPVHEPVTVALAGDSMMAVGLYPALARLGATVPELKLIRAFKSGTGLARPEVFDWMAQYPVMLSGVKPRVVLVAMGANDGQGFVQDGTTYPFGTPAWIDMYRSRVEGYVQMLESSGARVIWLELPPMRSGSFDEKIELLNRIDYAVILAHPNAAWISTRLVVGDTDGHYREYGVVHDSMTRLRQPDGIHLSDAGADMVAAPLMQQLQTQMEDAGPAAAKPEPPAPAPATAQQPQPSTK